MKPKWYEQAEYAALLLIAAAVPLSWRIATLGLIVLLVLGIVKAVKAKYVGNPALSVTARWCCVAMMALFAVYLLSGLRSENRAYGLDVALSKVYFVLFPLAALISDSSHLTHRRIRSIFYTLWVSLVVIFLVCAGIAVGKMIGGTPLSSLHNYNFYSIHHTYVALYITIAVAFAASEMVRLLPERKTKRGLRILLILAVGEILLTLFALAVDSRAGIVAIALIAVIIIVHLFWRTRNWRLAVLTVAAMAVCAAGFCLLLPESVGRLTETLDKVSGKEPQDERVMLFQYGMEVAKYDMGARERFIGIGEGDIKEHLFARYAVHGFKKGVLMGYRTHNQYLDTFLGCGFVGLAVLLAMLLLPFFGNRRQEGEDRPVVPAVVLPTLFFMATEMMLVRQMGIVFVSFAYYLLILWKTKK